MTPANRITTSDAATLYGIPPRTLTRWHNEGRITAQRHGRALLWSCDELDQLTDQRHGRRRLPKTPVMADHQQ
ncbi:helix-turn-helix domain-containing protein [Nonomuraea sp. NPDC049709]|uniref:helix-turn-helix domain-containing protein n=1 Tax=Nonomuraea sp. NPDC049709 TaxID=3154736 RepID=UPI0034368B28